MNVITVSTLALGITLTSALPADNPNSEVSVLKCGSIRVKDDTLPFKIIPLNASSLGDCHIVNSKPISFTVKKGCGCYLHHQFNCTDSVNSMAAYYTDIYGRDGDIKSWICTPIQ